MKNLLLIAFLVSYSTFAQLKSINVADLNFRIPTMSTHELMYGFSEGDKVVINYSEDRSKKLKSFEILEYGASQIYSEFNTEGISNKEISIKKTGIYIFRFENNSLARRICNLRIDRIPSSEDKITFDTTVKSRILTDTTYVTTQELYIKSQKYIVKEIASNQEFYINSGSKAIFDGKSRVAVPIILPQNTVKWYYTVSSFRDQEMIVKVKENVKLISQLSNLIDKTGGLGFAINLLTQPPGADYCDVYLINNENYIPFLDKNDNFQHYPVGTRENIKSANVEIPFNSNEVLYLGIRNPDISHGINVIISAAAIVLEREYGSNDIKIPNVTYRTEYYLE